MGMHLRRVGVAALTFGLLAVACGDDDESTDAGPDESTDGNGPDTPVILIATTTYDEIGNKLRYEVDHGADGTINWVTLYGYDCFLP